MFICGSLGPRLINYKKDRAVENDGIPSEVFTYDRDPQVHSGNALCWLKLCEQHPNQMSFNLTTTIQFLVQVSLIQFPIPTLVV